MTPFLLLEPFLEIVDEFFGRHAIKLFFIDPQRTRHGFGIFEPFFQHGLGDFVKLQSIDIGQLGPLEMVGKHLIKQIKVALTFYQDGSRCRVKFIQGTNQMAFHRPVQGQKRRGADRYTQLF